MLITDVLEHIFDPTTLWREMVRVLRSRGKIILTTPFFYWIHEAPHDYCRYTEHKLRMFCEISGLEVLALETYGGAPEVVFDVLAKHLEFSPMLSAIHLAIAKAFVRSRLGRRLSQSGRGAFPLGYTLVARKS